MTLTLSEIRHKLVIAAQAEWDRRIQLGDPPYLIKFDHFTVLIKEELDKHANTSEWRSENWQELNESFESKTNMDLSRGLWAVEESLKYYQRWEKKYEEIERKKSTRITKETL